MFPLTCEHKHGRERPGERLCLGGVSPLYVVTRVLMRVGEGIETKRVRKNSVSSACYLWSLGSSSLGKLTFQISRKADGGNATQMNISLTNPFSD